METTTRPSFDIAKKVLPNGLLTALVQIFERLRDQPVMLVGGTALAGFYAGHRRSDDLDLFCKDDLTHSMVVNSVRELTSLGAQLLEEKTFPGYYRATVVYLDHTFTCDIVLDANIFRVGKYCKLPEGPQVASLETILKMKSATLVSRASEKDIYDLIWLLANVGAMTFEEFLEMGVDVDGGANAEAVLISLNAAKFSIDACGFAVDQGQTPQQVLKLVTVFKDELLKTLSKSLHDKKPVGALAGIVEYVGKIQGKFK